MNMISYMKRTMKWRSRLGEKQKTQRKNFLRGNDINLKLKKELNVCTFKHTKEGLIFYFFCFAPASQPDPAECPFDSAQRAFFLCAQKKDEIEKRNQEENEILWA